MNESLKTRKVMAILLDKREHDAPQVQKILTGWGCIIRTRLGIHQGVLDSCASEGLVILDLVGSDDQVHELERKLNLLQGVKAKHIDISFD